MLMLMIIIVFLFIMIDTDFDLEDLVIGFFAVSFEHTLGRLLTCLTRAVVLTTEIVSD